jgi:hypothetical protein
VSNVERIRVKLSSPSDRATLSFLDLDGVRVGLRFRHNGFDGRWHLWLLGTDGTEFVGPIRMLRGLDLLLPYKHDARVPPGQLFVRGEEMDAANADRTSELCYRRVADVTEATPGAE